MVEIGGYTGKKIDEGACSICGETDLCALRHPDADKRCMPSVWEVEKARREYFKKNMGITKLKQSKL